MTDFQIRRLLGDGLKELSFSVQNWGNTRFDEAKKDRDNTHKMAVFTYLRLQALTDLLTTRPWYRYVLAAIGWTPLVSEEEVAARTKLLMERVMADAAEAEKKGEVLVMQDALGKVKASDLSARVAVEAGKVN